MPLPLLIVGIAAGVAAAATALHKLLGEARKQSYCDFPQTPVGASQQTCIQVQDASEEQGKTVLKAHLDAQPMVDNAIRRLQAAKVKTDPLVDTYFGINGTSSQDQKLLDNLISNYKQMKSGFKSIQYEAEKTNTPPGASELEPAYVYNAQKLLHWGGDIHVNFPDFDRVSDTVRATTVVHEMSHYYAGTDDHAYEWETSKWNALTPKQQRTNADSYSGFARDS